MLPLLRKEISDFLSSMAAYVTMVFFLIITGLFLWIFPQSESNILEYGYAVLDGFFDLSPYILMCLIPAITMRTFSEEKREGTFELLMTAPLTNWQIVLGKFFAGWVLVLFSLFPTLVYYLSVYLLGQPAGNVDTGAVIGSYLGLVLLGGVFVSIGLFCSSLTNSQIAAFLLGVFLCFFFFSGFESVSAMASLEKVDSLLITIGIRSHYTSISRGVLDTRDLVYFISLSLLFLLITRISISKRD